MSTPQEQQDSDLAIALSLAMASTDEDDDDFQYPHPPISTNQELILKSHKLSISTGNKRHRKPGSIPLKPSNGIHNIGKRKKQNPREGKENINEPHSFHPTVTTGAAAACSPIQSSELPKKFNMVSAADEDLLVKRKDVGKGMSIESRLLCRGIDRQSSYVPVKTDPDRVDPAELDALPLGEEGVESQGFEPGTQLNALMELCCATQRTQNGSPAVSHLGSDVEGSEGEEEDIMGLMTQATSPQRISNDVVGGRDRMNQVSSPNGALNDDVCHQDCLDQTSSPYEISNDGVGSGNYPGPVSSPHEMPHTDLAYQYNLDRGSSVDRSSNDAVVEHIFLDQTNKLVHCPVCGNEITDLNDEERDTHTNDCLDRGEVEEISINGDIPKEDALGTTVDVIPVVKWLEGLNLSRYADLFIKEEIDWDTLQWLTEEDLSVIGITALGPRRKIAHALHELRKGSAHSTETNTNTVEAKTNNDIKNWHSESGNKLITEFFQGPSPGARKQVSGHVETCQQEKRPAPLSAPKRIRNKYCPSVAAFTDIPEWLCIPGTPFWVDAFRHIRGDCSHWFLTHFHTDHYQGLTRGFCYGKVYCSLITARLVNMRIGVSWDKLQVLPLNERVNIEGVYVTFIDANHCPGSVIILFEPPNGKAILHTGDFRICQQMVTNPILESCSVHTLILDTTYCNPRYDFPKQETVIQFVLEAIQAEAFNPSTLFLIGAYTIGKEKIFLEVAKVLRKKVYVGAAKLRLLGCLGLPQEYMQWLTSNEQESHIHVVPLWTIASFKRMHFISNQYRGRYNSIVAFSPTGWTFGKGKKKGPGKRWQQGTIIRYEVPYSEHCSFTELKEFVKFVGADNIIPSVNNDSRQAADNMVALLLSEDA